MDIEGMFEGNTATDDIAVLTNLLSQAMDSGVENATVYDDATFTEYGVKDILSYMRKKYGDNF